MINKIVLRAVNQGFYARASRCASESVQQSLKRTLQSKTGHFCERVKAGTLSLALYFIPPGLFLMKKWRGYKQGTLFTVGADTRQTRFHWHCSRSGSTFRGLGVWRNVTFSHEEDGRLYSADVGGCFMYFFVMNPQPTDCLDTCAVFIVGPEWISPVMSPDLFLKRLVILPGSRF